LWGKSDVPGPGRRAGRKQGSDRESDVAHFDLSFQKLVLIQKLGSEYFGSVALALEIGIQNSLNASPSKAYVTVGT
jgi:hypothetical protein